MFAGRLEHVAPAEILQLISLSRKTGKLLLIHSGRRGVIVFRNGAVVFAVADTLRSTLGEWISEGLTEQTTGTAGSTQVGAFESSLRHQIEQVIEETLTWSTGHFIFKPVQLPEHGSGQAGGVLLDTGINPEHLILKTLTRLDEAERASWEANLRSAPAGSASMLGDEPSGFHSIQALAEQEDTELQPISAWFPDPSQAIVELRKLLDELPGISPSLTAEAALLILRYASQVVNRGVLFLVRDGMLRAIGQFGLSGPGRTPERTIRQLAVPIDEPSVVGRTARMGVAYRGELPSTGWNDRLLTLLDGGRPPEVLAVPIQVDGTVVAVLYGDNVPEVTPIGAVDGLEILAREIGFAIERARLHSRIADLEGRLDAPPSTNEH